MVYGRFLFCFAFNSSWIYIFVFVVCPSDLSSYPERSLVHTDAVAAFP